RNDPRCVAHIARRLAALRGVPVEELAQTTMENGRRLFGIPDNTE
ncbi:MAG: TatD family hydrolase, partial [Christensenellales bacterium]